jgi:hypothetical protein
LELQGGVAGDATVPCDASRKIRAEGRESCASELRSAALDDEHTRDSRLGGQARGLSYASLSAQAENDRPPEDRGACAGLVLTVWAIRVH